MSDTKAAEVLVDDVWRPAEILTWSGTPKAWWANVRWWPSKGDSVLGTFPASEVREPYARC